MPLRDALVVATVSGVTTLNVFLSGALTVAIPSIGVDLHISEADLQWPLTVFSLAYGCTLLLFGRMGDIYGGRILFLAGSAWFAVWSIGTALAPNLTAITLFMAMLGLGAAANTPAGIGIIVAHFPPGARRNTAFGVLGAGQPLGYILGLVLGGLLSQSKATWRAIFYVQAALGALFVLLGIIYLPRFSSSSPSPSSSSNSSLKRVASPVPSIELPQSDQQAEKEPAYLPTLRAASPLYLPALYRTGSASLHRPSVDGNGNGRRSRMSMEARPRVSNVGAGNNNRMSVASWQSAAVSLQLPRPSHSHSPERHREPQRQRQRAESAASKRSAASKDSVNATGNANTNANTHKNSGESKTRIFLPTPTLRIEPATGRLSFSLSRPAAAARPSGEVRRWEDGARIKEEDKDREGRDGGRGEQEGEETLVAAPAPASALKGGKGDKGKNLRENDGDEHIDLATHKDRVSLSHSLSATEEPRLSTHSDERGEVHQGQGGDGHWCGENRKEEGGEEEDGGGKLYDKGLDWGGALLSTAGIGLLTYSLAASATAPHGFRTPLIIALLVGSIVLLGVFWAVEVWRENRGKSVLMPPSIWRHPRARMPATIGMVFFAWWNFNTLLYLCALYYQQVHLLSPLQTSLRFLPSIITGVATNLAGGWLMNRVAGLPLILGAVTMNMVAALLFSLMEVNSDFWRISLWVMILLAGADLVYPAGTLQVSSAFDNDSKSLAGGIFTVATRLGASIGMAVTTSITTSVSSTYHASHPNLSPTAPEVLLVGFRAGAWSLFAAAAVSFFIALVGLRGIGIIGSAQEEEEAPKQAEALSDGTFVGGV